MDHSFTIGPVQGLESPEEMIVKVAKGGATAFLVHKGIIKALKKPVPIGMIMHISASTNLGLAPNRKMLNSSVLEGLRLGADAISVHVNMGSKEEPEMLAHLGMAREAQKIEAAVLDAVRQKETTADIGGTLGTREAGEWVAQWVASR